LGTAEQLSLARRRGRRLGRIDVVHNKQQQETVMPALIALALSVGVLAVAATWLFLVPAAIVAAHLQVWQAFIAWGCHYHSGGKFTGTRNTIICMSFGAVVGMAAVLLAAQLGSLGAFAAPVAVGLGAAVICLASAIPLLSTIPASVYGFAAIAGLILLGKDMTATSALLPTILSIIIGAIFGFVSEVVMNALKK
jgi:hypothetical protein